MSETKAIVECFICKEKVMLSKAYSKAEGEISLKHHNEIKVKFFCKSCYDAASESLENKQA